MVRVLTDGLPQPAAASLRDRTADPAVAMLHEVDAEVKALVSVQCGCACSACQGRPQQGKAHAASFTA